MASKMYISFMCSMNVRGYSRYENVKEIKWDDNVINTQIKYVKEYIKVFTVQKDSTTGLQIKVFVTCEIMYPR